MDCLVKIRLRFSTTNSLISRLIRWRDWSDYSHVDFIMPDGRLLGALSDGVKLREVDSDKYLILEVEVTEEQYDKIHLTAIKQLNKSYDFLGVFGFAFNRYWQETDKWFCFELVAYCFKEAGVNLLRYNNLSRISSNLMLSPLLKEPT